MLETSSNNRERIESKNKLQLTLTEPGTANIQITSRLTTKLKNQLEMTPALIVPSLLVLVCLHLQAEAAMGSGEALWCGKTTVANLTAITQGTGTEALNAKSIARCYLKGTAFCEHPPIEGMSLDRVNECGNISLIDIPSGSGLQGTADASSNLNKLLYMYYYLWRQMEFYEQDYSEFMRTESSKMYMLGVVFTQLSNQVRRYLQVNRCSCSDSCKLPEPVNEHNLEQEINQKLLIEACTPKILLNVIVQDLQHVTKDTLHSLLGRVNSYDLHPYQFCRSLKALPIPCETTNENCNTSK